ncbi:MAG: acrR [Frankiales bacterium]|nr:acrR [Frankiales bacterium]
MARLRRVGPYRAVVTTEPGRRLTPDARREEILASAHRLFGARPYAQVSTTDIASGAGVARGLLNHYFGTKRELYVEVVRRMTAVPDVTAELVTGSLRARVDLGVSWYLDVVGAQGEAFLALVGAEGPGADPEVEAILEAADDLAARRVLEVLGADQDDPSMRGAVRAYGGLAKAAVKEWVRTGALTREDVHLLLTTALRAIAKDVLPVVGRLPTTG